MEISNIFDELFDLPASGGIKSHKKMAIGMTVKSLSVLLLLPLTGETISCHPRADGDPSNQFIRYLSNGLSGLHQVRHESDYGTLSTEPPTRE